MRWKERFLVPDHRVRDINGASFAGFYYVCVELGDEEERGNPNIFKDMNLKKSSNLDSHGDDEIKIDHKMDGEAESNTTEGVRNQQTSFSPNARTVAHNQNQEAEDLDKEFVSFDYGNARKDMIPNYLGTKGKMTGFYFHENSEP